MQIWLTLLVVIAASGGLFYTGRSRALAITNGDATTLHSKPAFHGGMLLICGILPAAFVFLVWTFVSRYFADASVASLLGEEFRALVNWSRARFCDQHLAFHKARISAMLQH